MFLYFLYSIKINWPIQGIFILGAFILSFFQKRFSLLIYSFGVLSDFCLFVYVHNFSTYTRTAMFIVIMELGGRSNDLKNNYEEFDEMLVMVKFLCRQ